ncbi:MAG: hypothetical protein M3114_02625 [Thermoproteota archaeon]|nr:hypothetical protein [Thermoproteota archaeon]
MRVSQTRHVFKLQIAFKVRLGHDGWRNTTFAGGEINTPLRPEEVLKNYRRSESEVLMQGPSEFG